MIFNGYYNSRARSNFLAAALKDAGVLSWQVVARDNAITSHPSDFDVIKVRVCLIGSRFKTFYNKTRIQLG